jgi:hypothetical protein
MMSQLTFSPYGIGDVIATSILLFLIYAWIKIWNKKLN